MVPSVDTEFIYLRLSLRTDLEQAVYILNDPRNQGVEFGSPFEFKMAAIDNIHMLASGVNILHADCSPFTSTEQVVHLKLSQSPCINQSASRETLSLFCTHWILLLHDDAVPPFKGIRVCKEI